MHTDTPDGTVVIASSPAALDTPAPDEPVLAPVFDIAPPAAPRQGRQASLSRLEAQQAQRRRRRQSYLRRLPARAATWRHWLIDACASVASRVRPRAPVPRPPSEAALEHQESKGFIVAVLLALTVVVYGGSLGVWREHAEPDGPVTRSTERRPAAEAAASLPGVETVVPRRVVFTPTAWTQTSTSQRREIRSLEQALDALPRQTPAFHRCDIGVVETDRAMATCEGVAASDAGVTLSHPATWTLEFRRVGGRWFIARVAMR